MGHPVGHFVGHFPSLPRVQDHSKHSTTLGWHWGCCRVTPTHHRGVRHCSTPHQGPTWSSGASCTSSVGELWEETTVSLVWMVDSQMPGQWETLGWWETLG